MSKIKKTSDFIKDQNMKYLCSFFVVLNLQARDVILIENLASHDEGKMLIRILKEKFHIPQKLITYKTPASECSKSADAIMQLCLKNDGEMEIIKLNKFVIENSLRAFLELEEK